MQSRQLWNLGFRVCPVSASLSRNLSGESRASALSPWTQGHMVGGPEEGSARKLGAVFIEI